MGISTSLVSISTCLGPASAMQQVPGPTVSLALPVSPENHRYPPHHCNQKPPTQVTTTPQRVGWPSLIQPPDLGKAGVMGGAGIVTLSGEPLAATLQCPPRREVAADEGVTLLCKASEGRPLEYGGFSSQRQENEFLPPLEPWSGSSKLFLADKRQSPFSPADGSPLLRTSCSSSSP